MNILMVAAENGALAGGKVGGMGDVIRDVPIALCEKGHSVNVLMPGYQKFSKLAGAVKVADVSVTFGDAIETIDLYSLPSDPEKPGLKTWILEHPKFAPVAAGNIYDADQQGHPFATDASKFALFCIASAQASLERCFGEIDVIHLHDWHSALFAVLANYDPVYFSLAKKVMVYTIHNLSLQGIRPFANSKSSLQAWYPHLKFNYHEIKDPRYDDCFNPMRAAINLCDKVHAVSHHYIKEIQLPSNQALGFVGGEGLERDLGLAAHEQRLVGILNGCEYSAQLAKKTTLKKTIALMHAQLTTWLSQGVHSQSQQVALASLAAWDEKCNSVASNAKKPFVMSSVGRVSDQKVKILRHVMEDGRSSLEHILDRLCDRDLLILLGSGDADYEAFISEVAARRNNLIYLRGYADALAQPLYGSGDLFLMPSSFEPCGISQMLAMRAGQPCLVHQVGGLVDTIKDGDNGFGFNGGSPVLQASNMLKRLDEIIDIRKNSPKDWNNIKKSASQARFLWADSVQEYVAKLYR